MISVIVNQKEMTYHLWVEYQISRQRNTLFEDVEQLRLCHIRGLLRTRGRVTWLTRLVGNPASRPLSPAGNFCPSRLQTTNLYSPPSPLSLSNTLATEPENLKWVSPLCLSELSPEQEFTCWTTPCTKFLFRGVSLPRQLWSDVWFVWRDGWQELACNE